MPRKGHVPKRTVEPDPVYGSDLVTKFVNSMMWQGKKSTAEGIFYEALKRLETKTQRFAMEHQAPILRRRLCASDLGGSLGVMGDCR
jgi:ribosomal protein S7